MKRMTKFAGSLVFLSLTAAAMPASAAKIGVTMSAFDDNFLTVVRNSMKSHAASQKDVSVQFEDAQNDIGKQLSQVQNFIAQKVDAIVVNVVDTEVTPKISKMVSDIQSLAGGVVSSMSQAAQAVESSSGKMRESVDCLGEVAVASQQTVGLAEHIANASDQQSLAGQEVARNMEVISQLSEENQLLLKKLWQSMEILQAATNHVDDSVDVFRLFEK